MNAASSVPPSPNADSKPSFDLNLQHGHKDLVQSVAFNTYGDRCATGSVDGYIRVFNRHRDGTWRLCDVWHAHGGPVLELQWLPATVFPNLVASLGGEGWFRMWAEDPSAASGRRFNTRRSGGGGPGTFSTKSQRAGAPFRSFSLKHCDDSRSTYLALLATDARLSVWQNDQPETLTEFASIDEFSVGPKPARGEEVAFRVRFDPGLEPCYTALRAGVSMDALGLVVASMDSVKVYRSRDVDASSYGVAQSRKEFYLAADIVGHRGLVRDVAWAPGNIRGYDIIATACQDGYARLFRLETPYSEDDGRSWSAAQLLKSHDRNISASHSPKDGEATSTSTTDKQTPSLHQQHHQQQSQHPSTLSASLAKSGGGGGSGGDRQWTGEPGQVRHTVREISKLDNHRTPVWRVGFDDDGQILGSTGDDGRLMCYRQTPDGSWAKSSELAMMKTRMAVP